MTQKCLVFQGFQKKEAFIAAQGKQIISINLIPLVLIKYFLGCLQVV